jgi:hypothetical protein
LRIHLHRFALGKTENRGIESVDIIEDAGCKTVSLSLNTNSRMPKAREIPALLWYAAYGATPLLEDKLQFVNRTRPRGNACASDNFNCHDLSAILEEVHQTGQIQYQLLTLLSVVVIDKKFACATNMRQRNNRRNMRSLTLFNPSRRSQLLLATIVMFSASQFAMNFRCRQGTIRHNHTDVGICQRMEAQVD